MLSSATEKLNEWVEKHSMSFDARGLLHATPKDADGRCWHEWEAEGGAKPVRLCPCSSDVDLFGYGESVIDLNAEIPDGALDLRMSQKQLHGT